MCTVKSIADAIRENCQSQHDMESADIDRVLQSLPFALEPEPPEPYHPSCLRPFYRSRRKREYST